MKHNGMGKTELEVRRVSCYPDVLNVGKWHKQSE